MLRFPVLVAILVLAGCNGEIYVRDGVTDGDTFYLSPEALTDNDPALQAWTSYSLTKSACQLEIGGGNPARANSYGCEMTARKHLLETWDEQVDSEPSARDDYLETLAAVQEAGHLDEYVVYYFGTPAWQVPAEVDMAAFREWQRRYLRNHKASTRIVGSWNYRDRVTEAMQATLE